MVSCVCKNMMPGSRMTERTSLGQGSATSTSFISRTMRSAFAAKTSISSVSHPRVAPMRGGLKLRECISPCASNPETWIAGNTSTMVFSISLPSESRKTICLRMKVSEQMRWNTPG